MANKMFILGLFLLSVANVKAQTLTQTDSLTMETVLHNLPVTTSNTPKWLTDCKAQTCGSEVTKVDCRLPFLQPVKVQPWLSE